MYHIKDDQRAVRSAEAIYAALVNLIEEKSFAAITVTEIVAQAEVARATFYRGFDVQEDVLRWRCDQLMDEIFSYIASFARSQPRTASDALLKPILRFFYLDSTFIELLIQTERTDILQGAFQTRLERLGPKVVALLNVPEDYLDYWFALRAAALVSMLVQWVKGGKRQAPDDLADGIAELARKMSQSNLLV
ncbi:MAG: TetR/AcrR family transcriptional regulator [Anaerolineae bacterium]